MGYKSFYDGASVTEASATKEFDLGTTKVVESEGGPQVYRYVYNDEASNDFFVGCVVVREAAASATHAAGKGRAFDGIRSATAALHQIKVLGVAQTAIPAGEYGWILMQGVGTVKTDGGVVADDLLATHTAGLADTATSAEVDDSKCIGHALEDDSAAALVTAYISLD